MLVSSSRLRPQALIVDDDDLFRRYLQGVLAAFGFLPNYAENAPLALRVLERLSPDLIITDIYMPGGDGFELINRLRLQGDATPIIAMSGGGAHPEYDALGIAATLGANACIAKPIRNAQLLQLIGEVMRETGDVRDHGASRRRVHGGRVQTS